MREVIQLNANIFPIIQATIDCANRAPTLFHLQSVINNLQIANYWLRDATVKASQVMASDIGDLEKAEDESMSIGKPPTLYSVDGYLSHISDGLKDLVAKSEEIISNSSTFPRIVMSKVEQGYNHIVVASYSLDLASIHYNEKKRRT